MVVNMYYNFILQSRFALYYDRAIMLIKSKTIRFKNKTQTALQKLYNLRIPSLDFYKLNFFTIKSPDNKVITKND